MMDKAHVAAAIEKFIEGVKAEQRTYEMRADDCRMQVNTWNAIRTAVMDGEYDERQLRAAYREVTQVIIMGDK